MLSLEIPKDQSRTRWLCDLLENKGPTVIVSTRLLEQPWLHGPNGFRCANTSHKHTMTISSFNNKILLTDRENNNYLVLAYYHSILSYFHSQFNLKLPTTLSTGIQRSMIYNSFAMACFKRRRKKKHKTPLVSSSL